MTYDQAERAFEAGRFESALKSVNEALARYDGQLRCPYSCSGRIYLETHRLEKAQDSFERVRLS